MKLKYLGIHYQGTERYVTWKLQNTGERNSGVIYTINENIPHHGRINTVKIPILPKSDL